jgi:hypothetical protein
MKQIINLGSSVGAHNGDGARTGGQKINDNFTELYGFSEVIFNELTILEDTKLAIANNLSDLEDASTARTNLGIGNIDNTSDANKPVSTAQATADATVLSSANSYTDSKVASVYKLKGSVANYAALPSSGQVVGDVWNLVDTGANYVWTGTVWDELGTTVDISVKANLASPTFTGIPIAPTATAGTNNTQIATTAFTTTAIAGKMNNPSLTASYIPKALNATTIGNSRLLDINGYLGIDAVYSPTKDITLGNQANREIGIEISNSLTVGRDLMLAAGKAINYAIADFVPFSVPLVGLTNFTINKTTLDIYAIGAGTTIYKKLAGSSDFNVYGSVASNTYGMSVNYITNDIWTISYNVIRKQTAGSGPFSIYTTTGLPTATFPYNNSIFVNPVTNDIWVIIAGSPGKLYKQTGGTGPFAEYPCNIAFFGGKVIVNPITNDVFIVDNQSYGQGGLLKQTGGSGLFTTVLATTVKDIDVDYASGTIYTIHGYGTPANGIYKQLAGTGSFVLQGVVYASGDVFNVNTGFNTLCVEPTTLNVLANFSQSTNRIYQQINYAAGTPNLQGGTLKLSAGTGKGTGSSKIQLTTGAKTTSGTDMQIETVRMEIDENGLIKATTMPSYTDNTAALAGGLVAGQFYRTSTGILMITY